MGKSWALSPAGQALPEGGCVGRIRTRLRLPGTAWTIRVRTLALCVSAALHVLVFGILAAARLDTPQLEPPPLVEVEFVEIAGARGGGGPTAPWRAAAAAASPAAPRAVPLADPAARQAAAPTPQQTITTTLTPGPAAAGGAGSGGGSGSGQGMGVGPSSGSGAGQGGVAVDRMPVPVRKIKPRYPMAARRTGQTGQVLLRLYVDQEGAVREVQVVRAEPPGVFDDAATEAVRKWRFEPAVSRGAAVGMWLTLPVRFALEARE